MCVVLVSCRRRCGVITPYQHRRDVILTSHACWEDEQLLVCGIIAYANSSVVHHRGLSAVGECKPADIQMECSIFEYRLIAFPFPKNMLQFIAEIMHPIGYRKVMQNESYFFLIFTSCPIPPLPCHTGRVCILDLCTLVSIFLLLIIAYAKSSVVHHRGLSAVGECKPADIQMECSIFEYRLIAFPFPKNMLQFIAEIMHPIGYRKVMQNESYFFLIFYKLSIPPLPCHTGRFCILDLCTLVSIFLLLNMAF